MIIYHRFLLEKHLVNLVHALIHIPRIPLSFALDLWRGGKSSNKHTGLSNAKTFSKYGASIHNFMF